MLAGVQNERSFLPVPAASPSVSDAILRSAVLAFSERGYHGASLRELAAGAGVTLSNIYNYFEGKQQILLCVLREAVAAQLAMTQRAIDAAGEDVADRLAGGIGAFVGYYVENRRISIVATSEFRYLEGEARREIVEARDRTQAVFTSLVREGVASGRFSTPYPHEATLAMLTMCASVAIWYRPNGELSSTDVSERYARLSLALVEGCAS